MNTTGLIFEERAGESQSEIIDSHLLQLLRIQTRIRFQSIQHSVLLQRAEDGGESRGHAIPLVFGHGRDHSREVERLRFADGNRLPAAGAASGAAGNMMSGRFGLFYRGANQCIVKSVQYGKQVNGADGFSWEIDFGAYLAFTNF